MNRLNPHSGQLPGTVPEPGAGAKTGAGKWAVLARALLLAAYAAMLGAVLMTCPEKNGIYMDQMTFLLQALSIARDGDLQYTPADRERFHQLGWGEEPLGLFLRTNGTKYYYGKPAFYALLAAPFCRVAPNRGALVLNALLWAGLVELGYRWFRRRLPPLLSALLSLMCWGLSAAPFYVFVIHPDILIAFLLALFLHGVFLAATGVRTATVTYGILLGILGGLIAYSRVPLLVFVFSATFLWLVRGVLRPAAAMLCACAAIMGLFAALHLSEDGSWNPYLGSRIMVLEADPYSTHQVKDTATLSAPTGGFFQPQALATRYTAERLKAHAAYSPRFIVHFLAGRRVGLFPYLTPFLLLGLLGAIGLFRKNGMTALWVLVPFAAYAAVNFLLLPFNYQGGATAIGNRYALQSAPALLYAFGWTAVSPLAMRFALAALAAAAVYFPGRALRHPDTTVRDNFLIAQWNRFRLLPIEPELIAAVPDREDCIFQLDKATHAVCLSAPDPSRTFTRFWYGKQGNTRLGLVREDAGMTTVGIRLSTSAWRVQAEISSGNKRHVYDVPPQSSVLAAVQLCQPVDMRGLCKRDVFYWPLEIRMKDADWVVPDESLPKYFVLHVNLAQQPALAEARSKTGRLLLSPADSDCDPYLLWGWCGPGGVSVRWAGDTRSSALALRIPAGCAPPSSVEFVAHCLAAPLKAKLWGPGLAPQEFTIRPLETTFTLPLRWKDTSPTEAMIRLDHEQTTVPAVLTNNPDGDPRALSACYRYFAFTFDAHPSDSGSSKEAGPR